MLAAIAHEPGTLHEVTEVDDQFVTLPNLNQAVPVTAFRGNAAWLEYALVRGRWREQRLTVNYRPPA